MTQVLIMRKYLLWVTTLAFLLAYFVFPVNKVLAQPSAQDGAPTSSEVIAAVNALRLARGIPALKIHPVLMQVAQYEADGGGGHWRPEGLTLGQWLITLGYPLSGDLSLDGYRSENWGIAQTTEEVITMWLGDDEHTNTMLSVNRSDIGAAVVLAEDNSYIIVIETALQTHSGQQQSDAYVIMTGIPLTQVIYSSESTLSAENGLLPQNVIPVARTTALADGSVYHEVKYGQSLWSIAIAYGTTINNIQQLNHLTGTSIRTGQHLLVLKSATQPAPREASVTQTVAIAFSKLSTPTMPPTATTTPHSAATCTTRDKQKFNMGVVAIGIIALFLGGLFTVMTKKTPV